MKVTRTLRREQFALDESGRVSYMFRPYPILRRVLELETDVRREC